MKIVIGLAIVASAFLLGPLGPLVSGIGANAAFAIGSIGASLVLGGISQALAGNGNNSNAIQQGAAAQIAIRQAAAAWQIIYGRSRVGGVIVYMNVTNKQFLHMVIVHAAHPCQQISAYWLDGRRVYFVGGASSGQADSGPHTDPSGNIYNFNGDVWIETRLGTETGSAFQSLTAFDPRWTTASRLQGHCCSYIRAKYVADLWPSGFPAVRVDIAGKNNIYDPRDGNHKYSENSALVIADVMTNHDYGLQCDFDTEIDADNIIAAANLCDERVQLATRDEGGFEERYSCNGTFDTSQAPGNIIENMLTSCAGRASCTGGLWRIFPAGYIAPTASFGDDDFIAPIKWMPKRKYRDLVNGVRGRFICPSFPYNDGAKPQPANVKIEGIFDGQWQPCDVPFYAADPSHGFDFDQYLEEDNNTRLWLDVNLGYTVSVAEAQRILKINLMRNRRQGTGTIQVGLAGLQCAAMDTIQLTHARLGWFAKTFEVTGWRLQIQDAQDNAGALVYVEMDIAETDAAVYSWSTTEELALVAVSEPGPGPTGANEYATFTIGTVSGGPPTFTTNVSWQAHNVPGGDTIKMQGSLNNGVNWTDIGTGLSGSGSWTFSVGDQVAYRVLDATNGVVIS